MFKFFLWFMLLQSRCFCFEDVESLKETRGIYRRYTELHEIFSQSKRHNFDLDDNQTANEQVHSLLSEIRDLLTKQLAGNLLEREKSQVQSMIGDINQLLSDRWFHLNDPNAVDCSYNKFNRVFASSYAHTYFLPICMGNAAGSQKMPQA